MGASDSKLVFKRGIFRLSQDRHIPPDEHAFWSSFWALPESAEDVFALFTATDVRRARDGALENVETLVLALAGRLFALRHDPDFPHADDNNNGGAVTPGQGSGSGSGEREALNCVRVLTRVLPFLYESEALAGWRERYFWGGRRKKTKKRPRGGEVLFEGDTTQTTEGDTAQTTRRQPQESQEVQEDFQESKPLAEELLDTLVDLLFFSGFTLPRAPPGRPDGVSYNIWQSGVGCNTALPTTREMESNRCEVLRLLLAMAGESMYTTPAALPVEGVRTLTYLCTSPDKQVVLSVLCSLLNTTLKYNPASWKVPYNALMFKDPKQVLVTYALQFLLVLLLYPVPEPADSLGATPQPQSPSPKNYYRHFCGRLHRVQDFQFIVDGMTRVLNQPLQEKSSYLPGAQSSAASNLAPVLLMLFWEMTQCNRRFRAFIIDTQRAHDLVVLALFYALDLKNDASRQGVVRMCAFLLQTLSVERNFGVNLNRVFEGQDTLPATVRIGGFGGTYADFLIQSIYNLISTSHGRLSAIYPALLAVINNIAPYLEGLSTATSNTVMQLFSSMSSPSFLLANDSNHALLRSLLESINSIVEHQYSKNPEFVFAVLRNKKRIEALRTFTLESGQQEIERRNRRRKESGGVDPINTLAANSARSSVDNPPSPGSATTPVVNGTFSIGGEDSDDDDDDDDDDDGGRDQNAPRSAASDTSRASSVSNVDDALPLQLRGMSEKARGKLPAGVATFSRHGSTTSLGGGSAQPVSGGAFEPSPSWIESWLAELPLHTLLTLMQQVYALLPRAALTADYPSRETLARIRDIRPVAVDPAPPRVHSFEWSPLALGWYESLLWGLVFSSEMQVAARGTVGVWNGTLVRLFRVQETAAEGPSLMAPRGAVDAVGSNLVSRIGAMNLRGQGVGGVGGGSATTTTTTTTTTTAATTTTTTARPEG